MDRLGLDKEKQLTDYNMLGSKLPDGLKMALTTCLLKTHEINALAKDPTDKLDHTRHCCLSSTTGEPPGTSAREVEGARLQGCEA